MFTGIILDVGEIAELQPFGEDLRVYIKANKLSLADQKTGNSIAVNGVCLTLVEIKNGSFGVDISGETLSCTTLGKLQAGSRVNLEPALTPTTALGGHMVSGHVDGVGELISLKEEGRSIRFVFAAPADLARYIAPKGSITLDGVSLTVNNVNENQFDVNIIPHTMQETIFSDYVPGSKINLEVDIIARYVARLIQKD
ncbi:MAG: riboflavin synthase [Gammaproteobacteria bacterium]|nr:riboflavin synthase [Gammaproteobacteria bacterium]